MAAIKVGRIAREQAAIDGAAQQIPALAESELFVAGLIAYWAEGTKTKPWNPSAQVTFINSDPNMVHLFLSWLALVGIEPERLAYRISIHESADVAGALEYWSRVVGVPAHEFQKTLLKTHKPRTLRRNRGDGYHGCLVVRVRKSVELSRQIAGWFQGLAAQLPELDAEARRVKMEQN